MLGTEPGLKEQVVFLTSKLLPQPLNSEVLNDLFGNQNEGKDAHNKHFSTFAVRFSSNTRTQEKQTLVSFNEKNIF